MPRATAKNYASDKANANWDGFVRCDMDAHAKEQFGVWADENPFEEIYSMVLDEAQEASLKVTHLYNAKEGTWMVSYTGTADSPKVLGKWTLTGWGGTPERAMQALWFKHTVMLEKNWVKGYVVQGKKDRDYVG